MVSATTKIVNPMGLHMRPAQIFVKEMMSFGCDVSVVYQGKNINAKSIMSLMAACIKQGSEIEIVCSGENEQDCLKAAVALIESGLGE